MKTVVGILGILLMIAGMVWFFQGIGLLPGSFMTGEDFWAAAGFLTVIVGVLLIRFWRRKDPTSKDEGIQPQDD